MSELFYPSPLLHYFIVFKYVLNYLTFTNFRPPQGGGYRGGYNNRGGYHGHRGGYDGDGGGGGYQNNYRGGS